MVVITIYIVNNFINYILYQFTELDEFQKREEFLFKSSRMVPKVSFLFNLVQLFNYEFYLTIALTIFGFLDNILYFIISLFILIYNIYSKITKKHFVKIIIDDREKNVNEAQRVSFLYKIKLVVYTIISIISITFLVIQFYDGSEIINNLRIINID